MPQAPSLRVDAAVATVEDSFAPILEMTSTARSAKAKRDHSSHRRPPFTMSPFSSHVVQMVRPVAKQMMPAAMAVGGNIRAAGARLGANQNAAYNLYESAQYQAQAQIRVKAPVPATSAGARFTRSSSQ